MADSAAWTLDRIEPPDNTFRDAGEDVHRAFWRWIASMGVDRFHWRCNQGLDRKGEPLSAIAESTRRRGRKRSYTGLGNGNNPPLVPALGLSRTEALLKGRGFADHAEWYWTEDPITGLNWGQVMLWHKAGGGGRYPKRDVIGWSREDVLWFQRQGATWWYAHQHGLAVAKAMNELESRAEKFPRLPTHAPVKFKVTRRVDVENFTFGIGGTEAMVRRSIEEGTFSGFSKAGRYRPPSGPTGGKAKPPETVPMKPKPRPAAAPAAPRRRPAVVARPTPAAQPAVFANPLMHEVTPQLTPQVDLAAFAAKAAAKTVANRFGDKVFIAHAHKAYVQAHGPILLADYKELLGRSLQARHLNLSRTDIVHVFDRNLIEASETFHPIRGHEYHFFDLD